MRMGTNTDLRLLTFFVDDFVNNDGPLFPSAQVLYFDESTAVVLSTHAGS